jgi:hypothetical protein
LKSWELTNLRVAHEDALDLAITVVPNVLAAVLTDTAECGSRASVG